MTTVKPLVVAMALVLALAARDAWAQLANPTATRSTTQVVQPPPPPPPPRAIQVPPAATPSPMPTQLGQRPQPTPITTPQRAAPPSQDEEPARRIGAQPAKVYDRDGRVLEGMEQAGPNRVRDSRTGRYYDTVPMGDGQRIQPGG